MGCQVTCWAGQALKERRISMRRRGWATLYAELLVAGLPRGAAEDLARFVARPGPLPDLTADRGAPHRPVPGRDLCRFGPRGTMWAPDLIAHLADAG